MPIEFTGDDVLDALDNPGVTGDSESGHTGNIQHGYSYVDADTIAGITGWWPLHERSGDANDLSGNGNVGTLSGPTQGVAGRSGLTAYSFDGTDDNVVIPYSQTFDSNIFTFTAWINPDSAGSGGRIQDMFASNSYGWSVRIADDGSSRVELLYEDDGNVTRNHYSNSTLDNNSWQHIAVIHIDGITTHYIDGEFDNETDSSGNPPANVSGNLDFWLGANQQGGENYEGVMCGVRFYSRALTESEIQRLYGWGSGDYVQPPTDADDGISWWQLNSDASDQWGSNDGTINGAISTNDAIRGTAYEFNGSSDFIDLPSVYSLDYGSGQITVSAWAKPDTLGDEQGIVVDRSGGNSFIRLLANPSLGWLWNLSDGSGTGTFANSSKISTNDWYHVLGTYDSGELKLYVNGSLEGTANINSPTGSSTDDWKIGAGYFSGVSRHFDGTIDEVRIYDRALSQSEISNVYRYGTLGRDNRKLTINARPFELLVDSFESGDLSAYGGNVVDYEVQSSTVKVGNNALARLPGNANQSIVSQTGLDNYPEQGQEFRFLIYLPSSSTPAGGGYLCQVTFADQGTTAGNTNGFGSQFRTGENIYNLGQIGTGVNNSIRDNVSIDYSSEGLYDKWIENVYTWQTNGDITSTLYDGLVSEGANEVATLTMSDSSPSSGGIAVGAYDEIFIDDFKITGSL